MLATTLDPPSYPRNELGQTPQRDQGILSSFMAPLFAGNMRRSLAGGGPCMSLYAGSWLNKGCSGGCNISSALFHCNRTG